MHVLLSTIGSRGDVQPLVALALVARARSIAVAVRRDGAHVAAQALIASG